MPLQGYKTYIVAGLQIVLGVLASTDWTSFMNDPKAGALLIGNGVLMAVLRTVTTTPPGQKA